MDIDVPNKPQIIQTTNVKVAIVVSPQVTAACNLPLADEFVARRAVAHPPTNSAQNAVTKYQISDQVLTPPGLEY